jgi:hypothetical protein
MRAPLTRGVRRRVWVLERMERQPRVEGRACAGSYPAQAEVERFGLARISPRLDPVLADEALASNSDDSGPMWLPRIETMRRVVPRRQQDSFDRRDQALMPGLIPGRVLVMLGVLASSHLERRRRPQARAARRVGWIAAPMIHRIGKMMPTKNKTKWPLRRVVSPSVLHR